MRYKTCKLGRKSDPEVKECDMGPCGHANPISSSQHDLEGGKTTSSSDEPYEWKPKEDRTTNKYSPETSSEEKGHYLFKKKRATEEKTHYGNNKYSPKAWRTMMIPDGEEDEWSAESDTDLAKGSIQEDGQTNRVDQKGKKEFKEPKASRVAIERSNEIVSFAEGSTDDNESVKEDENWYTVEFEEGVPAEKVAEEAEKSDKNSRTEDGSTFYIGI